MVLSTWLNIIVGGGLSAVAKRRRLNDAAAKSTSTPVSVTIEPAAVESGSKSTSFENVSSTLQLTAPGSANTNGFAALPDQGLVNFSPDHWIRKINDTEFVIEISKGEKYLISGTFLLWVKNGVICLSGAIIEASPTVYHVFHSANDPTPSITCLGSSAELHIERIYGAGNAELLKKQSKSKADYKELSSISVLVQHDSVTHPTSRLANRTQQGECDFAIPSLINQHCREHKSLPPALCPRILVCRNRIAGDSMQIANLVNFLLTCRDDQRNPRYPDGVLLYDLDALTPEYGPPGMVTLTHILNPVLVPPYCRHDYRKTNNAARQTMMYCGQTMRNLTSEQLLSALASLPELEKDLFARCPVLINTSDVLENISINDFDKVAKLLKPTCIVSYTTETSDSNQAPGRIALLANIPSQTVTLPKMTGMSISERHRRQLRSYFRSRPSRADYPEWFVGSHVGQRPTIDLKYGDDYQSAFITAIHSRDDDASLIDEIIARLLDSIVAIVLEPREIEVSEQQRSSAHGTQHSIGRFALPPKLGSFTKFHVLRSTPSKLPLVNTTYRPSHMATIGLETVGLAVVKAVDIENRSIELVSPVSPNSFLEYMRSGRKVHLVVQEPPSMTMTIL